MTQVSPNTIVSVPLTLAQIDIAVQALGDAMRHEAQCADRNPLDHANRLLPIAAGMIQAAADARRNIARSIIADEVAAEMKAAEA